MKIVSGGLTNYDNGLRTDDTDPARSPCFVPKPQAEKLTVPPQHVKTCVMPDVMLKVVLPVVGLCIILFCLGAFFFQYGTKLKDNVQEFTLFGANLKISILTVFILVGLLLTFAGTYFTVVDTNATLARMLDEGKAKIDGYEKQQQQLQGQLTALKLMQAQNKTLNYFLDLDGVTEIPNPKHLKVVYKLWGDEDKENVLSCTPITRSTVQHLSVTIADLAPGSFVTSLVVEDVATKRKWKAGQFFPFSPSLKLTQF